MFSFSAGGKMIKSIKDKTKQIHKRSNGHKVSKRGKKKTLRQNAYKNDLARIDWTE